MVKSERIYNGLIEYVKIRMGTFIESYLFHDLTYQKHLNNNADMTGFGKSSRHNNFLLKCITSILPFLHTTKNRKHIIIGEQASDEMNECAKIFFAKQMLYWIFDAKRRITKSLHCHNREAYFCKILNSKAHICCAHVVQTHSKNLCGTKNSMIFYFFNCSY